MAKTAGQQMHSRIKTFDDFLYEVSQYLTDRNADTPETQDIIESLRCTLDDLLQVIPLD